MAIHIIYISSPWGIQLRLVLWTVLCEFPEALNMIGPECGSWGLPNRGTSLRNYVNVWGAMHLNHVSAANMCMARIPG